MIPHAHAFVVLSALAGAAYAQEAPQQTPEQERAAMKKQAEDEAKALPTTRVATPAELMTFSIENNHLRLETTAPPTGGDRVRVDVPGMDGVVFMQLRGEQPAPGKPYLPEFFMLQHHDYTQPDAIVSITHVSINPAQIQVARDSDRMEGSVSVQLIQSGNYLAEGEDMVRLYVQGFRKDNGAETVKLNLAAPSVVELVRKFPTETSRYLEPIFNDLGQADVLFHVNPQTAWQVLAPAYEPPAELSTKVLALLKQLDADNPQQREAASAELKTLGQPAAIVLMRQDRSGLSAEQNTQLDTFLAPFKPLPEEEAAKMRTDPKFLLLALGAEDAQLRKLALDQLQKVTKQQIEFEVNGEAQVRTQAITRLRAKLIAPTTNPTTKPVAAASTQPASSP